MRSSHIQQKLLSEADLSYEKALEVAVAMETASRDAVELQTKHGNTASVAVDKVHVQPRKAFRQNSKPKQEKQDFQSVKSGNKCWRCTRPGHGPQECRFKEEKCHKCGRTGHIKLACRSRNGSRIHVMEESRDATSELIGMIGKLQTDDDATRSTEIIWVTPNINGQPIAMELDTGSAVSVMSKHDYDRYLGGKLRETDLRLRTYSGEELQPRGVARVMVNHDNQRCELDLYVLDRGGPPLFGRDWLRAVKLDWANIKSMVARTPAPVSGDTKSRINSLADKYSSVFSDELGTLRGIQAKITLKDNSTPKYCKARSVPYALKPRVEMELDRLVQLRLLSKVDHSDWATPIVPVVKKDGSVRICGDFKVTLNPLLEVDRYPLPRIEDIFATLAGGKHFTKLDLRHAYLQMEVREDARQYLTITTHKGLFRYNRLVFGIASAPAIWQRTMEQILQGIPGVQCLLDDMIITGKTDAEHLANLEEVLERLQRYGLKANLSKCHVFQDKVVFCGHEIDKQGLHKTQEKIDAVLQTPYPKTVTQLRAFLGLVNYYARVLPDLASLLHPLHQLLEKGRSWDWSKECNQAFGGVKRLVTSDRVLTHYDPDLPVKLACDTSPYGLGAVLSHTFPDGSERPIAFASRSLNAAEKGYSQIDKEALGLVWGVKKFTSYLFGRHFVLVTDHQPLLSIFHPRKGIPVTTAARLQRYALFLAGHDYTIEYKATGCHGNADSLSRLPVAGETPQHRKG